jgi:hypothetical protein
VLRLPQRRVYETPSSKNVRIVGSPPPSFRVRSCRAILERKSHARRQRALPRSPVPPMPACPALRPRWCPGYVPCRPQDCCLPATGHRRLSPHDLLRTILLSTTLRFAGLHHAACLLAPPGTIHPCAGMHAGALLTCWRGFDQVGLEPYRLAPTGYQPPMSGAGAQCQGCGLPLARPVPRSAKGTLWASKVFWAAGPFTPRKERVVTHHALW